MAQVTSVGALVQLLFYLSEIILVVLVGLELNTSELYMLRILGLIGLVGGIIAAFPLPMFMIQCLRHEFEDADDFDSMFHANESPNPISPTGLAFMRFFATGGNIIQLSSITAASVYPVCTIDISTYQWVGLGFILAGSQFALLQEVTKPEEIAKYLFLESGDRMAVYPVALSVSLSMVLPWQQCVILVIPSILGGVPLTFAGLQRSVLRKSYVSIINVLYLIVAVFGLFWPWLVGFGGIVDEFCWQREICFFWGISVLIAAVGLYLRYQYLRHRNRIGGRLVALSSHEPSLSLKLRSSADFVHVSSDRNSGAVKQGDDLKVTEKKIYGESQPNNDTKRSNIMQTNERRPSDEQPSDLETLSHERKIQVTQDES